MRPRGGHFLGLRTHYQFQHAGEVSAMREDRQRELSGRRTKFNFRERGEPKREGGRVRGRGRERERVGRERERER